ncbi:hypothetical protein AKO1_014929, partial [Acrasis kona]
MKAGQIPIINNAIPAPTNNGVDPKPAGPFVFTANSSNIGVLPTKKVPLKKKETSHHTTSRSQTSSDDENDGPPPLENLPTSTVHTTPKPVKETVNVKIAQEQADEPPLEEIKQVSKKPKLDETLPKNVKETNKEESDDDGPPPLEDLKAPKKVTTTTNDQSTPSKNNDVKNISTNKSNVESDDDG